jgi:1-acyl-sn-glycerol-3-phosphate acyltransferase
MDPFLISYHIGVKNWTTIVPIRYPVTHEYMSGKIITLFIKLFGGYNIGETPLQRLKGLTLTRDLLRKKYSVVIFPEGKINYTEQEVAAFRKGVEMLFSYEYPVVFARLTHLNRKDRFAFWRSSHRASIEYSRLFPQHSSKTEKINHMLTFFNIPTQA